MCIKSWTGKVLTRRVHYEKNFFSIIIALLVIMSFAACNQQSDTDSAKESIQNCMDALKAADMNKARQYAAKDSKPFLTDAALKENPDDPEEKWIIDLLASSQYKFKSGSIKDGEEKGTFIYEITSKDLMSIISQSMDDIMAGKSEDEILSNMDVSKLDDQTRDVEITVQKEGGKWKVVKAEDLLFELAGMEGLAG